MIVPRRETGKWIEGRQNPAYSLYLFFFFLIRSTDRKSIGPKRPSNQPKTNSRLSDTTAVHYRARLARSERPNHMQSPHSRLHDASHRSVEGFHSARSSMIF